MRLVYSLLSVVARRRMKPGPGACAHTNPLGNGTNWHARAECRLATLPSGARSQSACANCKPEFTHSQPADPQSTMHRGRHPRGAGVLNWQMRFGGGGGSLLVGAVLDVPGRGRCGCSGRCGRACRRSPGAFDAPTPDWRPGHRGVDLAGAQVSRCMRPGREPWCSPTCWPGGRWCRWPIPADCGPAMSRSNPWCGRGSGSTVRQRWVGW